MIDKKILIKSVKNALKEDCVNKDLSHKVLGKDALKKINAFLQIKKSWFFQESIGLIILLSS